jgi:ABC-type transport system involved in multi-copper enzyme maturation permease subunit
VWHLVSVTLRYYRRWLVSAWAMALAIAVMVRVLTSLNRGGEEQGLAFLLASLFLVVASMVVGIIVQATESSEKRARLLMTLPVTRGQLAGAQVLAPLAVLALGVVAGSAATLAGTLLGVPTADSRPFPLPLFIAGQTGFYMFFPTLMPAIGAYWQRGRRRAALGIGFLLALGFSFLTFLQLGGAEIPGRSVLTLLPLVLNVGLTYWLLRHRRSFA